MPLRDLAGFPQIPSRVNLNPSCSLDQWLDDECGELARVLFDDSFEFSKAMS